MEDAGNHLSMHTKRRLTSSLALIGAMALFAPACGDADTEEASGEEDRKLGKAESALVSNTPSFYAMMNEDGIGITNAGDGATCFLSGVAGNLRYGSEFNFSGGLQGLEAMARVVDGVAGFDLIAHGGAYTSTGDEPDRVWAGTWVKAQATCLFNAATDVGHNEWKSPPIGTVGVLSNPVRITGLGTRRQCFLSGILGVDNGGWNNSVAFARVVEITTVDALHTQTGWYVEGNTISTPTHGDHTRVEARCVDFPSGTTIERPPLFQNPTSQPLTLALTSGAEKACALTRVQGAFNSNLPTDGVIINKPVAPNTNWTMTLAPGKSGQAVCVED